MKSTLLPIITAAAALAWAAFLALTGRESNNAPLRDSISAIPVVEKHFVTSNQLLECGALAETRIKPITALAHDNSRFA